jgi:hypothetical protein
MASQSIAPAGSSRIRKPLRRFLWPTALRAAWGDRLVQLRTLGGTVPANQFIDLLRVPVVGVALANFDDNQHTDDENLRLGNLWDGIETLATIMRAKWTRSSGMHLDWRMLGENPHASYRDLVSWHSMVACEFDLASPIHNEFGPPAMTHPVDGKILPLGEVNCDQVVNSARTAMSGSDYSRADVLIGRALERVVSHELVHMLKRSGDHGAEGVGKPALSGRQLNRGASPLKRVWYRKTETETHLPLSCPLSLYWFDLDAGLMYRKFIVSGSVPDRLGSVLASESNHAPPLLLLPSLEKTAPIEVADCKSPVLS